MPLTPSQTRTLLEQLVHRPRKPLGQNFLIDGNIVRKSLQLAGLSEGDVVVEIGPGLGTLSEAMLDQGCQVYAVELDRVLAAHLRTTLVETRPEAFHLIEGDAVQFPRAELPAGTDHFKVVANLPYAITSPWLEKLLEQPLPSEMVLMMQREAADRITAIPGSKAYGAVSIFVGAAYRRAAVHPVSRNCFYPVPGVDSILLHLQKRPDAVLLSQAGRELIRSLFTQRRKQIGSLMGKHPSAAPWLEILPEYGCSPAHRPEAIPLEAWIRLDALLTG